MRREFKEVSTESHVKLSLGHSPINAAQEVSRFIPSQAQFHSTKHHQHRSSRDHATPRQTSKFDDSYCIRIARPWGRNNFTVYVFIFCFRLISTLPVSSPTPVRRAALHSPRICPVSKQSRRDAHWSQNPQHGQPQVPHAIIGIVHRSGTFSKRRSCTRRTQYGEDTDRRVYECRSDSRCIGSGLQRREVLTPAGFDTMGAHLADDVVLWHHLPDGNGSWG
jgi:hypothetical protein